MEMVKHHLHKVLVWVASLWLIEQTGKTFSKQLLRTIMVEERIVLCSWCLRSWCTYKMAYSFSHHPYPYKQNTKQIINSRQDLPSRLKNSTAWLWWSRTGCLNRERGSWWHQVITIGLYDHGEEQQAAYDHGEEQQGTIIVWLMSGFSSLAASARMH